MCAVCSVECDGCVGCVWVVLAGLSDVLIGDDSVLCCVL